MATDTDAGTTSEVSKADRRQSCVGCEDDNDGTILSREQQIILLKRFAIVIALQAAIGK